MPSQKRLRRHQKHTPPRPRHQTARRGEQHPITPRQHRPLHRPAKHTQLMTEHSVLNLQRRHGSPSHYQPREAPQHQVDQEEEHLPILRNDHTPRRTGAQRPKWHFRPLQPPTLPAYRPAPCRPDSVFEPHELELVDAFAREVEFVADRFERPTARSRSRSATRGSAGSLSGNAPSALRMFWRCSDFSASSNGSRASRSANRSPSSESGFSTPTGSSATVYWPASGVRPRERRSSAARMRWAVPRARRHGALGISGRRTRR